MLRQVNMNIERGELACLLGSNGAGKTTTLKAILRLIPLAGGDIFFADAPIRSWRTHQVIDAGIRVVPEGRRLFPKMTVLENLRWERFTRRTMRKLRKDWTEYSS